MGSNLHESFNVVQPSRVRISWAVCFFPKAQAKGSFMFFQHFSSTHRCLLSKGAPSTLPSRITSCPLFSFHHGFWNLVRNSYPYPAGLKDLDSILTNISNLYPRRNGPNIQKPRSRCVCLCLCPSSA